MPIIFEGVNDIEYAKEVSEDPLITGVVEDLSITSNIDFGLKLYPDAREVIAILDNSITGEAERSSFYSIAPLYPSLTFSEINCSELTSGELIDRLSDIPENTILIYIVMTEDASGRQYTSLQSVNLISTYSRVPAIGMVSGVIGYGLLGGNIVSMELSGQIAAEMANEIVHGKNPAEYTSIIDSPNIYCIDEAVMRKYGLDLKLIPKDARIINHTPTFLEKYHIILMPIAIIMLLLLIIIVFLWNAIPAEMAPLEDRSQISINTRGAEGVTYEYIRDYTEDINQLVDSILPDAESVTARVSSGSGNVRITLKDMKDRDYTQMEVAEQISKAVQKKTKARSFVQQSSSFGGRRGGMPVQYVLQATNIEKLQEVLPVFMAKVYENPVFQMADVNLKFSKPEARININRDKASIMGVSTRNIAQTLQYGLSGQRMGYFYMNGKQYEILGEINRQQRNKPSDLKGIYIRSDKGEMVQLDNLIELTGGIAPPQLYRYNRFVSATISAGLADGKTIGQGLDEMDKIAKETLDDTFRTALTGDSKEYRESSSSLMFAFVLAILLIYLILAAQFESFKDPLIIMLTVPLAIAGALIFMYFNDITMNVFSQIGIIMLIGLVAKNGILIVEFANLKQENGEDKVTAVHDAALQRLRPILMTSASTVLGLIPLAFATGEGCNQRIAMGIAVVGGMVVSTFLTMYIVPAVYSYISTNRINKKEKNEK